ncbi:Alpha/beta hydrolase [Candidatus Nitrotoga sp. HW29]|uniref:alpha/beta hydrolase n=1 Tax=Candidatus Nitrotoga sp. HW29 TaxID=2886963 RepID=UPI001EF22AE8|nr:alpha/beta hydrolase [Candidatus Nitrotoga sp. HW29]CAH1904518.1 Alpha/beta hydrolase [Candidatus Nitrotoga sp. HW29]
MNIKPTIVLVHGFWGGAAHWAKVIPILSTEGYRIRAVENPLTSLADDSERTRKMIKQIDGPVVLVGHSYGGAVITEMGDHPNVKSLVYIAAFAPDSGESPGSISQALPPEAFGNIQPDSDGYLWVSQEKFHESFCQDLGAEEALIMAVTQKAPLGGTFGDSISSPAWKKKPSWYQVSTADRMINPENQKMMALRMNPRSTIHLDASHASLASRPNDIAKLIIEASV